MLSDDQLRPASVIDARLSQGTHRKSEGINDFESLKLSTR